jgi:hypothetical protein
VTKGRDVTQKKVGWDFFVSYTQADRAWAEWIAWVLEEGGHRVLVQAWDFVPGSNWVQGMQDGVAYAVRTIAVLSPGYLSSVYGGSEWQAAWRADPQGRERKLLTVRVVDTDRPALLAGVVGVDIFDVDEATARARLSSMVKGAVSGRLKPADQPFFPGGNPTTTFVRPRGDRAVVEQARFPGRPAASDSHTDDQPESGDIELDPADLETLQDFVTGAFPRQHQAEAVLRRIGWRGPVPQFAHSYEAAWNDVFNEIRKGRTENPYRALLAYVVDQYPANKTMNRLARRYLGPHETGREG